MREFRAGAEVGKLPLHPLCIPSASPRHPLANLVGGLHTHSCSPTQSDTNPPKPSKPPQWLLDQPHRFSFR